jgi:PAS domain S-box-containing protein
MQGEELTGRPTPIDLETEDRLRRLELTLQRAEASFRTLVEQSPEPMLVHRQGVFVYVNHALLSVLHYQDPSELLGKSVMTVIHPDDHEAIRARMKLVAESDTPAPPFDMRATLRGGGTITVETVAMRIDFDGSPANLVIARDITEQRALQVRLMVSDRMASLGTLAAGVAHEINNPLAAVTTNLALIADDVRALVDGAPVRDVAELAEMVDEARQGAERVRKIVLSLQTFSRAEDLRRTAVDVAAVLDRSSELAFNEIKHRARLVKDYAEIPRVDADEPRLGQVFINLLLNAAHSIPEGRADHNEIRLVTRLDTSGRVVVEVKDTGCGIPANAMRRIFDPFYTTKGVGEGTGLGLSICHAIVTGLGGEITAESQPGQGSVFRVALPPSQLTLARPTPQVPPVTPSGRRGRILIVDDDALSGTSLRRVLRSAHDVTMVMRGREALDLLAAGHRFDVLLCDLMMPEVNGMDLYDEVSRSAPDLLQRIVFVTGGAFTPAAEAFLERVPNQWLRKPVSLDRLTAVVRGLVR